MAKSQVKRIWTSGAVLLLVGVTAFTIWQWKQSAQLQAIATKCETARNAGEWEQAQALASRWLDRDPDSVEAWLALADAAERLERWGLLADCLSRLPDDDPRCLGLLKVRGDLLLDEVQDTAAAEENWLRMLRIDPRNAHARGRLTYLYSMTLQRTKLAKLTRDSIHLRCEPPEAYYYAFSAPRLVFSDGLFKTTRWLQSGHGDEALKVAQAVYAARAKPQRSFALFGMMSAVPGDVSLVNEQLRTVPHNLELRAHLIEQAIADGDVDAVTRHLRQLLPEADKDCRVWRYRGWRLAADGDVQPAIAAYREGLQRNALDWTTRHELAGLQRISGDQSAAAKNAQLALQGKQLERAFSELPNVTLASVDQMMLLMEYMRDCGETKLASALARRIEGAS